MPSEDWSTTVFSLCRSSTSRRRSAAPRSATHSALVREVSKRELAGPE